MNDIKQKIGKIGRRLGWVPDLPDARDKKFKLERPVKIAPLVDMRNQCPPIVDQGDLGSCTANAIAGAIEFDEMKEKNPEFAPSRLFIYWGERAIEGTVGSDSGAQIRDGIKFVNSKGVCKETTWPYNVGEFTVEPPPAAWGEASHYKALSYANLDNTNLSQLQQCLSSGFPFVIGITVYESFMTNEVASTGMVPMPDIETEEIEGGHALLVVGYDNSKSAFIVRNSWGTDWGLAGYCYIPYAYLTNSDLSDDFWTIKLVSA